MVWARGLVLPSRSRKVDAVVVAAAVGWSVSLVFAGLASLEASGRWPEFSPLILAVGLAAFAAGNIVFLAGVADRAFRGASKPVVAWLELLSCVIFFVGLAFSLLALLLPRSFF